MTAFAGCAPTKASGQVVVGLISQMDANMLAGWTNGSSNANLRALVFGPDVISWTREGTFQWNKNVVKDHSEVVNDDGSKTYTVTLQKGLVYNDGTPLTAKDFVFSLLLFTSPKFGELGGGNVMYESSYVGYDAYANGDTDTFEGVQLVDDQTYKITVAADALPYHYDIVMASLSPIPMSVVAPSADIVDNGEGKGVTINGLSVEELQKTINDEKTGYRYQPKVTAGPYQFESYDVTKNEAVIVANPNFAGTYDNAKPKIEKIVMKLIEDATMMDELSAGTVDLLASINGANIDVGLDLCDEGKAAYSTYDRAGYGQIQFCCDFGPTQFVEVRQAIAYCLDRVEFAKQFSGGYASVVDGAYGLSSPEYKALKDKIEKELNHYEYNVDTAKELLIENGWTLNSKGEEFVEGKDDVRYKEVNGELMGLEIEWCASTGNPVSALISTMLVPEAAKAGIKINQTNVEFGTLLQALYRADGNDPQYHMFNLATGFVPVSSLWYEYSDQDAYIEDGWNTNYIRDKELVGYAEEMKKVPAEDTDEWNNKWFEFQKRWNYLLPNIPLYSDEYHNFYNPKLQNYKPDALWTWEYEIVYANVK